MSALTDPARELADLCDALRNEADVRGDQFLANKFGVDAWSRDFYQILFTVADRVDHVAKIAMSLDMDDDYRQQAVGHISALKGAFQDRALRNTWRKGSPGPDSLSAENVQALKMLSMSIRPTISYPKLSDDEVAEVIGHAAELHDWLKEHQLSERDFVRQALIEGLEQFIFRLTRIKWLGWGYTVASLQQVIGAYMALQRGYDTNSPQPEMTDAASRKVLSFIQSCYGKLKSASEITEVGDFVLRAYGAASVVVDAVSNVAGLLPKP